MTFNGIKPRFYYQRKPARPATSVVFSNDETPSNNQLPATPMPGNKRRFLEQKMLGDLGLLNVSSINSRTISSAPASNLPSINEPRKSGSVSAKLYRTSKSGNRRKSKTQESKSVPIVSKSEGRTSVLIKAPELDALEFDIMESESSGSGGNSQSSLPDVNKTSLSTCDAVDFRNGKVSKLNNEEVTRSSSAQTKFVPKLKRSTTFPILPRSLKPDINFEHGIAEIPSHLTQMHQRTPRYLVSSPRKASLQYENFSSIRTLTPQWLNENLRFGGTLGVNQLLQSGTNSQKDGHWDKSETSSENDATNSINSNSNPHLAVSRNSNIVNPIARSMTLRDLRHDAHALKQDGEAECSSEYFGDSKTTESISTGSSKRQISLWQSNYSQIVSECEDGDSLTTVTMTDSDSDDSKENGWPGTTTIEENLLVENSTECNTDKDGQSERKDLNEKQEKKVLGWDVGNSSENNQEIQNSNLNTELNKNESEADTVDVHKSENQIQRDDDTGENPPSRCKFNDIFDSDEDSDADSHDDSSDDGYADFQDSLDLDSYPKLWVNPVKHRNLIAQMQFLKKDQNSNLDNPDSSPNNPDKEHGISTTDLDANEKTKTNNRNRKQLDVDPATARQCENDIVRSQGASSYAVIDKKLAKQVKKHKHPQSLVNTPHNSMFKQRDYIGYQHRKFTRKPAHKTYDDRDYDHDLKLQYLKVKISEDE